MQATSRTKRSLILLIALGVLTSVGLSACAGTMQKGREEIEDLPGAFTFTSGETAHGDLFE